MNYKSISNPFKGTKPYQRDDYGKLFGRSEDLIKMKDRIFSERTTLLFASSGVGKTSFLNALVIPELEEFYKIFYFKFWATNNIARELNDSFTFQFPHYKKRLTQNAPLSLKKILTEVLKDERVLIIFDQFEEAFHHHQFRSYFFSFLEDISDCINQNTVKTKFIFSMREEFLGDLSVFDNLIPDLFGNYYRLKFPNKHQAKIIIKETSRLAKKRIIDEDKLDVLVDDLSKIDIPNSKEEINVNNEEIIGKPFIIPTYLQIVCMILWENTYNNSEKGKKIFLENYEKNHSKKIITDFTHQILNKLSIKDKLKFSDMLNYFITTRGSKLFITLENLSLYLGTNISKLEKILNKVTTKDEKLFYKSERPDESIWYGIQHDVFIPILLEWRENFRRKKRYFYSFLISIVLVFLALSTIFVYQKGREISLENQLIGKISNYKLNPTATTLKEIDDTFKNYKVQSKDTLKIRTYGDIIIKKNNEFNIGIQQREKEILEAIDHGEFSNASKLHTMLHKSLNDSSKTENIDATIIKRMEEKVFNDIVDIQDSVGYVEVIDYIDELNKANFEIESLKQLITKLKDNYKKNIIDIVFEKEKTSTLHANDKSNKVLPELFKNPIEIIQPPDGRIRGSKIKKPLLVKFRINPIFKNSNIYVNKELVQGDSVSLSDFNQSAQRLPLECLIQMKDTLISRSLEIKIDNDAPLLVSFILQFQLNNSWISIPNNSILLGEKWKLEGKIDEQIKYCYILSFVWDNIKNQYRLYSSSQTDIDQNNDVFIAYINDVPDYFDYYPTFRKVKFVAIFEDLLGFRSEAELYEGYIPAHFRSTPLKLSMADIRLDILNLGFYDAKFRNYIKSGFENDFLKTNKHGLGEIYDLRTGLVWLTGAVEKNISYTNAISKIEGFNDNRINNYETWRIPTLQEAYSLVEANKNQYNLYIDSIFPQIADIWVSDYLIPEDKPLSISFKGGTLAQGIVRVDLLAVRNLNINDILYFNH